MKQRFCEGAFRVSSLTCLTALWFVGGCAPRQFGPAIAHHAEKAAVTDAAARHTTASPYYRFNSELLSDLDDAIECTDVQSLRRMANAVLRGANVLGQNSNSNEIERMPGSARSELARIGGISDDLAVLRRHLSKLANATLESDLREVDQLPLPELRQKLRDIRKGIEDLPDDRGRTERQVLYSWAAIATANGIATEEAKLPEKCLAKAKKKFDRIAIWRPRKSDAGTLLSRYAPIIGMEWPANRLHDVNSDRIGAVTLSADGARIEVQIDPSEPAVYAYTSTAKIDGRVYRQLNYVWWFPERPEMTRDDPVAGHIDGAMLRVTLDVNDVPMFVESSLNCGCAHEVFVSDRIESAARGAFGSPLDGKHFSVEKSNPEKHDIVVIHVFDAGPDAARPLVLSAAGYHEVCRIEFNATESINAMDIVEEGSYRILDYDTLDALPLGDRIASMFGPDGLVHYAGRPEGFLLAPSGILSAGQPRKRGTQRIRWDDYLHDDPHLLEKTLRIPPLD